MRNRSTPAADRMRRWAATAIVAALVAAGSIGAAAHADDGIVTEEAAVSSAATDEATIAPAEEPAEDAGNDTDGATPASATGAASASASPEPVSAETAPGKTRTTPGESAQAPTDATMVGESDPEPIEHVGVEYATADGATYYVAESVEPGAPIRLSGSGWTTLAGDAGSVIAVRLSGADGLISTKHEVTHPVTGAVQANKTIYGIVQASAAGEWELEIPFPTIDDASEAWAPGDTRTITLLTGSLLTGDVVRSAPAPVTVAASDAETYTVTDGAGREITYTVPTVVVPGEDIVVSGTNWRVLDGSKGSVFSVLIDATRSGDPNTVYTTRDVVNPVTGEVSTDKRLHAIVEADADGDWRATIPYPTAENAQLSDGTWTDWAAGSTHQIRFLSGTLETRTPDVTRSLNADVRIEGTPPAGPSDPPAWAHETVSFTDAATGDVATAWVEKDIDAGSGATIRIKGTGWTTRAGTGASTVAIKLNHGDGQQYTREGSGVVQHPSAVGDDTIWTLLAPSNPQDHPNVVTIDADGDFEVEIDAPDGLTAGQYLSVLFQSGRFDPDDVLRTVTTGYLTVGGVPYEGGGAAEEVTCVPTVSEPTVTIEDPQAGLGGTLRVTGAGWCHPDENRGGSAIAFKIDEGAYSHLTADLHQNQTIWAVATAEAADGTFDIEIPLPDGTTSGANGSTPAFAQGAHTLRLLSGSLKSGDTVRSVLSGEFVVGDYRPNGAPDPLDAATLTSANTGGVTISKSDAALTVVVPDAQQGDWIFLTPYAVDGSPRYPWRSTWFQADASGVVVAPLAGATLPVGTLKVAVQSGNQGELGALRGWGRLTVEAPPAADSGGDAGGTAVVPAPSADGQAAATRPVYTLADRSAAQAQVPEHVPDAPFATDEGLTSDNAGDVTGFQDGTVVTITLPGTQPGDWVYLYAYSTPIPVGWIQVDENRQVRVDVAALTAGTHKLAVLDEDGELIGWTTATVTASESTAADADTEASAQPGAADATTATPISATGGLSAADWWLLGGGAVLVLAALAIVLVVRRRRTSSAAGSRS
ncbi:hypothetical protein [Microbacterium sp. 18062]|uniref:hypothetical protein n=1 Tax=Microbacterium sp. 18062 TaxID=2681410 RepID=UPI00135BCD59|nr:hypothetical protein [Microbacterium sp. 18062]